jgi:CHASE2 domain-containing sensor protein
VFDEDGPLRRVVPFIRSADRVLPSLGVAAALAAGQIGPARRAGSRFDSPRRSPHAVTVHDVPAFGGNVSGRRSLRALINYRGPACDDRRSRPSPPTRSSTSSIREQILAGVKPDIGPAAFRDKIVAVGISATGLADVFATPFGETGKMPGIQCTPASPTTSSRTVHAAGRLAARVVAVVSVALVVGIVAAFVSVPWTVGVARHRGAFSSCPVAVLRRRVPQPVACFWPQVVALRRRGLPVARRGPREAAREGALRAIRRATCSTAHV